MKKLIFVIIISLFLTSSVWATEVLYKLSSGEVEMISDTAIPLYMFGADNFAVLTDLPLQMDRY